MSHYSPLRVTMVHYMSCMHSWLYVGRKEIIDEAIAEAKEYVHAMHDAALFRAAAPRKGGSPDHTLFQLFKKPSEKASKHAMARIAFEEMVRRAEKKLVQAEVSSTIAGDDSSIEKIDEVTSEPRKLGTVLTSSELADLLEVSGCTKLLTPPTCSSSSAYREIDGTCNNLQNPLNGAAGVSFRRILPAFYGDGVSSIRGSLPSPRLVSTTILQEKAVDEPNVSYFLMQFGQFLNHDMNRSPSSNENCNNNCQVTGECLPIFISPNTKQCLSFTRSAPACTKSNPADGIGVRNQINDVTSFIDGSMIYGSDSVLADSLREKKGGRLLVGQSIPPGSKPSLPSDNRGGFRAGDGRVNEQIALMVIHTIWMREHNRIANTLARINPQWDDEKLYQEARKIVGAELQKITYYEYLPAVMGQTEFDRFIGQYVGYNRNTDPTMPTEFSTAAYRFGHSLVRSEFNLLDKDYRLIGQIGLDEAFLKPALYTTAGGTDQVLRGLLTTKSSHYDVFLSSILTNKLFGGSDLASLNIQRGRDHGLPPYSSVSQHCQKTYRMSQSSFPDTTVNANIAKLYGSFGNADLWPAGLAESPLSGSVIGQTFACLFGDAFKNLRDGDRFYFENQGVFTTAQKREIDKTTMSRVICDNADAISVIIPNAFVAIGKRIQCSSIPSIDLNAWRQK